MHKPTTVDSSLLEIRAPVALRKGNRVREWRMISQTSVLFPSARVHAKTANQIKINNIKQIINEAV